MKIRSAIQRRHSSWQSLRTPEATSLAGRVCFQDCIPPNQLYQTITSVPSTYPHRPPGLHLSQKHLCWAMFVPMVDMQRCCLCKPLMMSEKNMWAKGDLYTVHCHLPAHHFSQRIVAENHGLDWETWMNIFRLKNERDILRSVGISISHPYYLHLGQTIQPVLLVSVPIQRRGIHE